jgi:hypothetical protein
MLMYLKPRKASTDPQMRSLLQKAVRRGADAAVEATTRSILDLGDRAWLRSRSVVITFEEAWPLAQSLSLTRDQDTRLAALLRVSRATKQKDAAGLGALAFALHEGDESMLDLVPSDEALQLVAAGLDQPAEHFKWTLARCSSAAGQAVIEAAKRYLPSATWGWDKATILAAAYLAGSGEVPDPKPAGPSVRAFPYWVALDKHTPEGKDALRKVAATWHLSYRQLIWAGFYFESALVNASEPSQWFQIEQCWRLRKAGLDSKSAEDLWRRVRPLLSAQLSSEGERLRARVERHASSQGHLFS